MASNQLKFNVDDAKSTRDTIKAKATQIDNTMKEVKSSMQSVSSWWKGDAVSSFIGQYDKISKDVTKLIECVNTIATQLDEQARAQAEEDGDIARKLNKTIQ